MTPTVGLAAVAVLVGAATAACQGPTRVAGPQSTAVPVPTYVQPACPSPGATDTAWPAAVPSTLPKPPGAHITDTQVTGPVTYVRFTSAVSLHDGILFVVDALRDAGFTLGRGDAEANEADAPFNGPTVIGALRLSRTAPCLTSWVLAVESRTPNGTPGPLLPHTTGPSPSALPFG